MEWKLNTLLVGSYCGYPIVTPVFDEQKSKLKHIAHKAACGL